MCETIVYKSEGMSLSSDIVRDCIDILGRGGIIIIPTDTVYGIACNVFDPAAIKKIYALKGRDYSKPLPVLLESQEQLGLIAHEVPPEANRLIKKFWPGPLTLVFKTSPMAMHATRGKGTIAVRVPDHGLIKDLLGYAKVPLAATSANISGSSELKSGKDVVEEFTGKVDLIIDAGESPLGKPSSVVDATHFPFTLLRAGAVAREDLYKEIHSSV